MIQQTAGPLKSPRKGPTTKGQNNPHSSNINTTDTALIHTLKARGPEIKLIRTGKISQISYRTSG